MLMFIDESLIDSVYAQASPQQQKEYIDVLKNEINWRNAEELDPREVVDKFFHRFGSRWHCILGKLTSFGVVCDENCLMVLQQNRDRYLIIFCQEP